MTAPRHDPDLTELAAALWGRRLFIAGAVVLATLVALGVSWLLPKMYRATAVVVVTESKVPATDTAEAPSLERARLYADTYAELLRSAAVGTDLPGVGTVDASLSAKIQANLSVRPIVSTLLLRVTFDDRDPQRAQRVLEAQIQRVERLSRDLNQDEVANTREVLQEQVEASRGQLAEAEKALREYRSSARTEETRKRLDFALTLGGTLQAERARAAQEAATLTAEVASLAQQLKDAPRVIGLSRSVTADPAYAELLRSQSPGSEKLLGLQMRSEEVNPVVEEVEPEYAKRVAQLEGTRARAKTLDQQIAGNAAEAAQLQRDLGTRQTELEQRELRYNLAKETYESFTKRFENARLSVAARGAELRVVEPPRVSTVPVSPRPLFNAAVGALAALLLSCGLVVLLSRLPARSSE